MDTRSRVHFVFLRESRILKRRLLSPRKSPAEALQEVNPKLASLQDPEGKEILFLPPIISDDIITLLGGATEVYRY